MKGKPLTLLILLISILTYTYFQKRIANGSS